MSIQVGQSFFRYQISHVTPSGLSGGILYPGAVVLGTQCTQRRCTATMVESFVECGKRMSKRDMGRRCRERRDEMYDERDIEKLTYEI